MYNVRTIEIISDWQGPPPQASKPLQSQLVIAPSGNGGSKARYKLVRTHRMHAWLICCSIPYRHFHSMGLLKGLLHIVTCEATPHNVCAAYVQDIHYVFSMEDVKPLS